MSTPEIELHLLEHFLEHSWKKMDDRQKADFFTAVECRVNDHKALLPHLLQTNKLAQGVTHLLEIRLAKILRTHAAVSVIGHGLVRGAGLGGPPRRRIYWRQSRERQRLSRDHPGRTAYCLFAANDQSLSGEKNEIGEKIPRQIIDSFAAPNYYAAPRR